ncbi:MAG: protein-glutamate O-methyltransferase CheR [Pirellulaceae bacterium]|nr:protein-glutamate O-methyltransferase CheR [Planctomycetales bacterium]MCA9218678.1 protein-glutamate O-methyltransferase CheR [Planctomycetales bacterium]
MSLSALDIDFLRDFVVRRSGNVLRGGHSDLLETRLLPVAKSCGLDTVQQLVTQLRRSEQPKLSDLVAEAITVNETSFFRDIHPFDALRKRIIPDLINRNQESREIRIWCAASSSGQEPYSIAMVLREFFSHLTDWTMHIVATDLSEKMVERSQAGQYTQLEIGRGLPVSKLVQFFERHGTVWQARQELRDLLHFRRMNLTTPWPYLGQFDVVFMRNVLIYFDQATKADVLRRVRRVIRRDGYLFLGSAETVIGLNVPFQREELDATVCYRPTNG